MFAGHSGCEGARLESDNRRAEESTTKLLCFIQFGLDKTQRNVLFLEISELKQGSKL